jgi:hypothetical protein
MNQKELIIGLKIFAVVILANVATDFLTSQVMKKKITKPLEVKPE